mgnify:CR=1 FL=1
MYFISMELKSYLKNLAHFIPLKKYFIRNRWAILAGLLSLLIVDFLQLIIPLVIKKAIDLLTTQIATSLILLKYGLIILSIASVIGLFRFIWRYLILGNARRIEQSLRNEMYANLQTLPLSFYQKTNIGDLMARAINDVMAIRISCGMGLVALIDGIVLGIAAVGFMVSINWKLTLISLIPAPIIITVTRILTKRMSSGFESVQKTFADLTERVREAFAGIRVTKAYNREQWEYQKIKQEGNRYISVNLKLSKSLALFFPLMAILTNISLVVVIGLGGRYTISGNITTGDFVAFITYLNLLTWPMMAMGWVSNLVQRGSASMRRINRILEEVSEIRDPAQSLEVSGIRGNILIKGLWLRYSEQKEWALRDINMELKAGDTAAIVGRVGSGKTTLLQALPRLLNIPAGTVFVGGNDIYQMPLKILRQNIGFATQEAFIFSDTVRNNVIFGREGISEKHLEMVLHAAGILEDIQGFENGLDTMLGERGITLSGGQRQRLTIARAVLADPLILILDDALSMVDTDTEEHILNQILELRHDRTNLIVSHRVSTISRASRIFVFEMGQVIEQGTHEELLKLGGIYSELYEEQLLDRELEIGVS